MSLHIPIVPTLLCGCMSLIILASCSAALPSQGQQPGHDESLIERVEREATTEAGHDADPKPSLSIESLLSEIDTVVVEMLLQSQSFRTLARTSQITQYPCSNCHGEPLSELQANLSQSMPKAHWDIVVEHADQSVMECTTCHTPDDLDQLQTLTGKTIGFDHSYQICAQCHSTAAEDWSGGAHGKRVGGWAPPRVVHNCVNCHNPHQPAWDMRWPAVLNGAMGRQP